MKIAWCDFPQFFVNVDQAGSSLPQISAVSSLLKGLVGKICSPFWLGAKFYHESNPYPLVMTNIAMVKPWPMKIDGLPIDSMVDLSMANC